LLRHGNADLRLTDIGRRVGLINDEVYSRFQLKQKAIESEIMRLEQLRPKLTESVRARLANVEIDEISGPCTAAQLLRRQGANYKTLLEALGVNHLQDTETTDEVELQIKYSGYIKRQLQQVNRFKSLESRSIPRTFDYDSLLGFSREVSEKLKHVRPASIGQASRISGVTPAAISLLLVALERFRERPGRDNFRPVSF
jgi:tRNA uridine 5-carboxymethylaminomethyl modification enzyme